MSTRSILFILVFLVSGRLFAQPGDPPIPDVPITGLEILIGIGSILGASRFLKGKNKSKQ